MEDYYKILGITEDEKKLSGKDFSNVVKKKFKKLAIKYHPDKWVKSSEEEKKNAEEMFKKINEANSVLSDPQKRRTYDLGGSNSFFSKGYGDFFKDFNFGGGFYEEVNKGDDITIEVSVTLHDVHNGVNKTVNYERTRPCSKCNGTGSKDGEDITCPHCGGSGRIVQEKRMGNTMFRRETFCPHCGGKGKVIKERCPHCGGRGYESFEDKITLSIVNGVFDGAITKINGKGGIPKGNGINGDLIVIFREEEDEVLKRDGNSLIMELELSLDESICGCEKNIKTIGGTTIKLKIPELTKPGKTFRLSGKGTYDIRSSGVGDLFVVVKYKLPDKINSEQKKLIKDFCSFKNEE